MARLVSFFLLVSCLAATAFSQHPSGSRLTATRTKLSPLKRSTVLPHATFGLKAATAELTVDAVATESSTQQHKTHEVTHGAGENAKMAVYLGVWYLGNVLYNIYNKKACVALGKNAHGGSNLHWALSALQLFVGVLFVVPIWLSGLRKSPNLTADNWKEIAPVGLWAALSHAFSVLALGAGAVSFGQIVKSAEPVFAAATNALLLRDIDHPMVYLALLPIIGGVGLASLKELSFTWTALIAASLANQAAAFKNVVSKGVMGKPWAKALGPANSYAVVNIMAMLFVIPFVLVFELKEFGPVYESVVKAGKAMDVLKYSIYSGLAYYIYNEASFLALEKLSPVTHSVANTLKRVVIIIVSAIVFNSPMNRIGAIGSGIAVLGTLLFSLAKNKYSKKKGH